MSESKIQFSKDNIDGYLKALGKEYRKRAGKGMKAELILVGGAAILVNYGFRDTTTDVDALIQAASSMKDAINHVGDTFGLPNGWLNEDFAQTVSFSPKLVEYSTHYRTYANVLEVRTIAAEYLIAMKLRSGRQYKNDLSDVLGILAEHEKRNQPNAKRGHAGGRGNSHDPGHGWRHCRSHYKRAVGQQAGHDLYFTQEGLTQIVTITGRRATTALFCLWKDSGRNRHVG